MTPKEKAEELFQLYLPYIQSSNYIEEIKDKCKQCAKIAVDEILLIFYDDMTDLRIEEIDYWTDVKSEIEKL